MHILLGLTLSHKINYFFNLNKFIIINHLPYGRCQQRYEMHVFLATFD